MDPNSQASTSTTSTTGAANNQDGRKTSTTRYRSLGKYLRTIQSQVHPGCKISQSSIAALDSMVASLLKRISTEARSLALRQKRPTLLARDIEFACRLVLPTELHKDALNAGKTAVTKYEDTFKRDRPS